MTVSVHDQCMSLHDAMQRAADWIVSLHGWCEAYQLDCSVLTESNEPDARLVNVIELCGS